jgi:hypothetical protein
MVCRRCSGSLLSVFAVLPRERASGCYARCPNAVAVSVCPRVAQYLSKRKG